MVKKILLAVITLIAAAGIAYALIPKSASDEEIGMIPETTEKNTSSAVVNLDEKSREGIEYDTFSIVCGDREEAFRFRKGSTAEEWVLGEFNTKGWTVKRKNVTSSDGKYYISSKLRMREGKKYTAKLMEEGDDRADKKDAEAASEDESSVRGTLYTLNSGTPLFITGLGIGEAGKEKGELSLTEISNSLICGHQYNIYLSCVQSEFEFDKIGIRLIKGENIKKYSGVLSEAEKTGVLFHTEIPFPKDSSDYCASVTVPEEPGKAMLVFTFNERIISYIAVDIATHGTATTDIA